jgi:hypothetical protein
MLINIYNKTLMWIAEGGRFLSRETEARRTDDVVFVTLLLSIGNWNFMH